MTKRTQEEVATAKARLIVEAVLDGWTYTYLEPSVAAVKARVWRWMAEQDQRDWYWDHSDTAWNQVIREAIEKWEEARDAAVG